MSPLEVVCVVIAACAVCLLSYSYGFLKGSEATWTTIANRRMLRTRDEIMDDYHAHGSIISDDTFLAEFYAIANPNAPWPATVATADDVSCWCQCKPPLPQTIVEGGNEVCYECSRQRLPF